MQIVYFVGNKYSGKSTHSQWLVDTYGFQRESLADPIRRLLARVIHKYASDKTLKEIYEKFFVEDYGKYKTTMIEEDKIQLEGSRLGLEGLGEGCRLEIDEMVWVWAMEKRLRDIEEADSCALVAVDDVRRPFEEKAMRKHKSFGIGLHRPGTDKPDIPTERCQMYMDTKQIVPDVIIPYSEGIEGTQEIIKQHLDKFIGAVYDGD